MGDISDGMCVRCGGDAPDGAGGMCDKCRAIPATSVAKVKLACLREGFDVAVPEIEGAQYDIVVRDMDGDWVPVQVKTAYGGVVNTCRPTALTRLPYHSKRVSLFAIVDGDDVFFIPIDEVNNGGRMYMSYIRSNYAPFGTSGGEPSIGNTVKFSGLPQL